MKKRTTTLIVLGGVLIIVAVIIINSLLPKKYQWYESYQIGKSQPYDTDVTLELLKAFQKDEKVNVVSRDITETLKETDANGYFFIGHYPYYSEKSLYAILDFIKAGNTALIAANEFPEGFLDAVINGYNDSIYYYDDEYGSYGSDYTNQNLSNEITVKTSIKESYHFDYRERDKKIPYKWSFFEFYENEYFEGIKLAINENEDPILVKFKVGDGECILFSTPILLTNLYVSDSSNIAFTEYMFNLLPEGPLVWDTWSMSYEFNPETNSYNESEGPLKFILSEPPLRAAWYTLLIALFLFLFFRSKRQQQVIPLIEPNINRSLEFIQTVARMHYLRKDYLHIIEQQYRLWYKFILDEYQLRKMEDTEALISKLKQKSGVPEQDIRNILDFETTQKDRLSLREEEMHIAYSYFNTFYKNCH